MTKVSIVMPVYNAMPYLMDCIHSIRQQTLLDWELIAVDDFSIDQSYEYLQESSKIDSRIQVLKNTKKGIIPALQLAHHYVQGDYITRMDADDIMPPNKLYDLLHSLEQHSNIRSCAVGKVEYFSEGQLHNGYIKYAAWLNQLIDNQSHYKAIYKECVIPSPCWMMHRDTLEHIGAFNNDLYPEDYDLVFRIYKNQLNIIGINKVLHLWRDHQTRASRNDSNYQDQRFYHLKIYYFLNINYYAHKALFLWGAGKSAKEVAKLLIEYGITFNWISNNPKKIGKDIYNIKIQSEEVLTAISQAQIITSIKQPNFFHSVTTLRTIAESKGNVFYDFH